MNNQLMMKKILAIAFKNETKSILNTISSKLDSAEEILIQKDELLDFLYSLKENDYQTVIIENNTDKIDILKIVRRVKDIRPRIPQIIISEADDRSLMSLLHQEGIFFNCLPKIDIVRFEQIIHASIDFYYRKHKLNFNQFNSFINNHKE